jgi:capsid protein
MQRAVLTGAIPGLGAEQFFADPDRYQSVRWKLRGWTWVDPTKEVTAYKEAVKAGFTTVTKVIEQTGAGDDIEDVLEQREHELEMMQEHGLQFDTDPAMVEAPAAGVSAQPEEPDDSPEDDEDDDAEDSSPQQRVIAIRR